MKRKILFLVILFFSFSVCGCAVESSRNINAEIEDENKQDLEPSEEIDDEPECVDYDQYYDNAECLIGGELKAELNAIISNHNTLSYSSLWNALADTDQDPNNPNNVILLYSGESISKDEHGGDIGEWNREHVWAKSHGGFGTSMGPGTDIHHIRPTQVKLNSTRGNLDFGEGGTDIGFGNKKSGDSFEPRDEVKGDVARMLMYMAVRYEGYDQYIDLELNEIVGNGSVPFHGDINVLLKWHMEDPVDEYERNRNDVIFTYQGNRNPFIDYPEMANMIWGTN